MPTEPSKKKLTKKKVAKKKSVRKQQKKQASVQTRTNRTQSSGSGTQTRGGLGTQSPGGINPESDSRYSQYIAILVDGTNSERQSALAMLASLTIAEQQNVAQSIIVALRDTYTQSINSPRPAEEIPSIRSWLFSAMIYCDAENSAVSGLVQEELFGVEQASAYWIFAALYRRKASYLRKVASTYVEFESSAVTQDAMLLARLVQVETQSEDFTILLHEMESQLASGSFFDYWPVLRAMRVFDLPTLIPRVAQIFMDAAPVSNDAYDAAIALSHNPDRASEYLLSLGSVEDIIGRLVEIVRLSKASAAPQLAVLVRGLPETQSMAVIDAITREDENYEAAAILRAALRSDENLTDVQNFFRFASFRNDQINAGNDFVGFGDDVQTFASIMIARQVRPPLAIGLFGDWGSGKSHFMRMIDQSVTKLSQRSQVSDNDVFCHQVVQIEFNAWHYVDTSLWASLVSTIFEKLSEFVWPQKSNREIQRNLIDTLGAAQEVLEAAREKQEHLVAQRDQKSDEYDRELAKRQEKHAELQKLTGEDIRELISSEAVKKHLDKAFEKMGVMPVIESLDDLNDVLNEAYSTGNRISTIVRQVFNGTNGRWWAIGVPAGLLLICLVAWGVTSLFGFELVTRQATTVITGLAAFVGSATAVFRHGVTQVDEYINDFNSAKASIEKALRTKREADPAWETKLKSDIAQCDKDISVAAAELEQAALKVQSIEQRIEAIKEEHSLARFLSDRSATDDYRQHLGLTSTIRKDFGRLEEKLKREPHSDEHRTPERIILYIDDLDRCPPAKVFEVLQSVHLLLAFELFVVVVGVDPRWLENALTQAYPHLMQSRPQTDDDEFEAGRLVSPQDYLEKIFQIQYCLPRMSGRGFERMVRHELDPENEADSSTIAAPTPEGSKEPGDENTANPTIDKLPRTESKIDDDGDGTEIVDETATNSSPELQNVALEPFAVAPEAMTMHDTELTFISTLAPLISTPRGVKRFANMYRLVKASVTQQDLPAFEGEGSSGLFKFPMLLLAMVVASPSVCADVFLDLYGQANELDGRSRLMKDALERIAYELNTDPDQAPWPQLIQAASSAPDQLDTDEVRRWVKKIGQFSFEVGTRMAGVD
ncbi:MAG: P-loop NTPase fold protein [Planctomycetota bacterium]